MSKTLNGSTALAAVLGAAAALTVGTASAAEKGVPFSTPASITFIDVTNASDQFLWRRLGDATGKPLYTYGKDETTGKSNCVDECAKEFPPFLASAKDTGSGDWSIIARPDGGKQWAYQGQPLYRYSGKDPAEGTSNRRARTTDAALSDPGAPMYAPKEGWKRAAFTPSNTTPVPAGITLKSIAVANGYGFTTANTGMAMYVFKAAPKNALPWIPVYAPGLAVPMGDFTIVSREDGKRQWAFRGQMLYTFKGDYSGMDLNGLTADKDARPALAYQNFMPDAFHIEFVPTKGPIMMTDKGLTLYTQSRYRLQYGGRETRDGYRYSYADAKAVNWRACVDACTKTWRPYVAPANAQPSGFWEIETRADGARQWSYKGSPLYTYAGDKKAGDVEGNNQHDILYGDTEGKTDLSLAGGDRPDIRSVAGSGFYWHTAGLF